jgi:DNA-binding MarR family transcriptional regulator
MTELRRGARERTTDSLWRALMRAASAVPRRLEKELAGQAVSASELDVLLALVRESPDPVRIGEIANGTGMSFSRASRAVGSLERRGWAERRACDSDGRGNQARITADGAALLHLLDAQLALRSEILAPVTGGDSSEFLTSCLDAIADRADADPAPTPAPALPMPVPSHAVDAGPARPAGGLDPAGLLDDLVRAQIEVWNAAEHALRSTSGVALPWYEALRVVGAEGSVRGADLARALLITESGASKLLARIEAAGLLVREADPADARASRFSLTDAGRTSLGEASEAVRAALPSVMGDRLEADEIAHLASLLAKFRRGPDVSPCA